MSRLETVRENWAEITNKLLRDKQLLAHFLRFSAGMYKQSFSDAALIYQQKREAGIVTKFTEYYAVRQMNDRRFAVCSISADDLLQR